VIFDLFAANLETSPLKHQIVAVIAPQLDLPHFVLYPRAGQSGRAAVWFDRLMRLSLERTGVVLNFPDSPEFQARYHLASLDSEYARRFFDPYLLRRLAQTRLLNVHGCGSTFTLSVFSPTRQPATRPRLAEQVDRALFVLQVLQEARPSVSADPARQA